MSKRKLPQAEIAARTGLRSDVATGALARWNPDLRAAADDSGAADGATISILDVIGHDFWDEGVTAKRIAGALRAVGDKPVTVTINSPGGDYFEGLAIYNLLREHPAEVTVKILGIAASAASVIAMAGDKVLIARSGFLMIHNTWVMAAGDRHALRDVADWLEPFDKTAVDIYAARTGLKEKDLAAQLDRETWIGGAAAVDQGFADDLLPADQIDASAQNGSQTHALRAERQFDQIALRAGCKRTEARELLAALKGGKPGAAPSGTLDAAEIDGLRKLAAFCDKI